MKFSNKCQNWGRQSQSVLALKYWKDVTLYAIKHITYYEMNKVIIYEKRSETMTVNSNIVYWYYILQI